MFFDIEREVLRHTTFFPSEEQCSHLLLSAHDEGTCTVTEATAGSSGLYSTATDMPAVLVPASKERDGGGLTGQTYLLDGKVLIVCLSVLSTCVTKPDQRHALHEAEP